MGTVLVHHFGDAQEPSLFIISSKNQRTKCNRFHYNRDRKRKGDAAMELLMELLANNPSEEPCEENSPAIEEESYDVSDYDYNKRIWF
ncbi:MULTISPECIES: hypothetical protein [Neobacillus]|uniref:Uncharacterized protein n=1 Tax=Neobacillus rhizophilus TaxID=2833579 RepID=A0A942U7L6_9BACI|nr:MULTISPECIES: hypothetical protein [Neobacillus]MBS4212944.1 hypothetical protein [Neobacillus rhizophilus]MBU8918160.1 hypothetical protein [Bacillus sp. FJAT-29953]